MASGAPGFTPSHPIDDQFYPYIDVRNPIKPVEGRPRGRQTLATLVGELSLLADVLNIKSSQHNEQILQQLLQQNNLPSIYRDFIARKPPSSFTPRSRRPQNSAFN
jgi:hypothetical protein